MEKNLDKILLWNGSRMEKSLPVLIPTLYGPSGSGKTWRAHALYTELSKQVPRLRWARMLPGTLMPEEVLGLPKVTTEFTKWTVPEWATGTNPLFLFVDELDKARVETLGSLLTLFAEGRIRDAKLPAGSMILAAMQPVAREEWLSDETGQAIGARLVYLPVTYDRSRLCKLKGLPEDTLNFLPLPPSPEPPLSEVPTDRQVEWCVDLIMAFGTDMKDYLYGVLPRPYADELVDRLTRDPGIRARSVLKAIEKNPELLKNLSIPECITLVAESWIHSSPYVMADIYHYIQIRGSDDDIRAAQKAIIDRLLREADEKGDTFEVFPGWDDPEDLRKALQGMSRRTAEVWRKRKGDRK